MGGKPPQTPLSKHSLDKSGFAAIMDLGTVRGIVRVRGLCYGLDQVLDFLGGKPPKPPEMRLRGETRHE